MGKHSGDTAGFGTPRYCSRSGGLIPGLRWGRLEISGGFLLLTAFLYYMNASLLLWSGVACTLHELGHCLVLWLCRGKIHRLRLSCIGAELVLSARSPLSPKQQLAASLAGPASNLLAALAVRSITAAGWETQRYLFSGLNLALACFNLLPVAQLDGGRALGNLLACFWPPERAKRFIAVCSYAVSSALVLGASILVLRRQANLTLLLTALWLFAAPIAGQKKKFLFS